MDDLLNHNAGALRVVRAKEPVDGEYDYAVEDGQRRIIAEFFGRASADTRPNAKANATLFTASHDLVAALKAQELADIALEDRSDNFEAWQKLHDEAVRLRKAALAKINA